MQTIECRKLGEEEWEKTRSNLGLTEVLERFAKSVLENYGEEVPIEWRCDDGPVHIAYAEKRVELRGDI